MSVKFQKAKRTKVKARMAICGPTGSGKTFTALTAATAFKGDGRIAVIDTERGSASLYSDIFDFDVLEMDYFDPLGYVEAIKSAESTKIYSALVIDSLSHAWEGEGGALDQVDQNAARYKGNSYAAWRTVTPKHRKLVDSMLQSNMHIIATMRSKMEYAIEKDDRGKTQIRRVGLQPVQRAGIEYEFTWVIDMDLEHNAVVNKSRAAHLAELVVNKPDESWFNQFYDWLAKGVQPARTKQELIAFGESVGLSMQEIGEALNKAGMVWDPAPESWADITATVSAYAGNGHNSDK
ncbi:MAG: ATP-binding protein [Anaerolineae bacterium]|nr:ATP-binding protein [Anaerolineae bacterium]